MHDQQTGTAPGTHMKQVSFEMPTFLIDRPEALHDALEQISKAREIALDTESNSLYVYQERICVIQICTGRKIYLFDPMRLKELSGLNTITSDPRIVKYIHGADYDVGGLKRDFRLEFNNIFDTMIAAQFLNFDKIGMADLVEHFEGVHLEKKFTKSNWGLRPISMHQMVYLCQDVQFLVPVARKLREMLKQADLTEEAEIEFRRLEQRSPVEMAREVHDFWNLKGVRALKPRELSIAYELYHWREKRAERLNLPPFKVLNNSTILDVAAAAPRNKKELLAIKGITETVYNRCGRDMHHCIQRGLSRKPDRIPEPEKNHRRKRRCIHWDDQALVDALKQWRLKKAEERGIHHLAVLPGYALENVAREKPDSPEKLRGIQGVGARRANIYGAEIIELVKANS